MARNVVMHHPNAFNCQVYRLTYTAAPVDPDAVGSMDQEDRDTVTAEWIGNGYALPAEAHQPGPMMDHGDAQNGAGTEFRFLIEPEEPAGNPHHFELRKRDILYLLLGSGDAPARLAFEVVGTEALVNIPPYTVRYICNRRDDLHVAAGDP